VEKRSKWIIDSGWSHHMTSDRHKFMKLNKFDGGIVRFGDNTPRLIIGGGSISLHGKTYTDDVLFVECWKNFRQRLSSKILECKILHQKQITRICSFR
jgi:hypothetical protein